MSKFGISQPVRRVEDRRFLTGHGCYVDDINLDGQLHAFVMRSSVAHARILGIHAEDAASAPGVIDVITSEELNATGVGAFKCGKPLTNRDGSQRADPDRPVLASGKVRYVGEPIALIVAESRAAAQDAAELIEIELEDLEAVTSTECADSDGQPQVHEQAARNLYFDWDFGDAEAVDAALRSAAKIVDVRLVNNRVVANSMEPRGALADFDAAEEALTLYTNTQGGWGLRDVVAGILGMAPERVRVLTPDVGGGFGMKGMNYSEQVLTSYAARKLGRPVKWTCDRSESFVSDTMGRDHVTLASLGFDRNQKIVAMRVDTRANMGAYLSDYAPFIPTGAAVKVLPGVYDVKNLYYRVRGVATNTTPVDAYRGAGRPESIFVIERLMDEAARKLRADPVALRKTNFIPAGAMPFKTAAGEVYDCGDFAGVMDAALARADVDGFEERRKAAEARAMLRGSGLCYYIESTMGFPQETAAIYFDGRGGAEVHVGTQSNGQGHETAYTQLLHEGLGIPFESIRVVQGDTARIALGGGTGGSRSVTAQGWAIGDAVQAVIERGRRQAAERLESAVEDVEFEDGRFRIVGTDRGVSLMELSRALDSDRDAEGRHPLDADATVQIDRWTFPNGCHVAEVEICPETGAVELVRYTVVDDFGKVINPLLLEGQVHGGIVQGAGQALMECAVYDDAGQLVSGSYMDYQMPRAADVPLFDFELRGIPTSANPLGMKGCGEAGSVGAIAAVANAVRDALTRAGAGQVDMPLTPLKIWNALKAAGD